MIFRDTVPILFNGGAYGTYLEYLLDTFTIQGTQSFQGMPFNNNGNAHQYRGKHLTNIKGWRNYVSNGEFCKFVRFHPKTVKNESLKNNILEVISSVNRAILIYPTADTTILNLNNYFFKIWDSWLQYQFDNEISLDKIYNNWSVAPGTAIDDIPSWIIREFLSLYLVPAWHDQVEWNLLDSFNHAQLLIVPLSSLLFNINPTLDRICNFCQIDLSADSDTINNIHQKMLFYQKNLHKDSLCCKIVQSTIDGKDFDYSDKNLTLIDESWIQWRLRELGYELKCDGLNQFPLSTIKLANKLYRA